MKLFALSIFGLFAAASAVSIITFICCVFVDVWEIYPIPFDFIGKTGITSIMSVLMAYILYIACVVKNYL